MVFVLVVHCLCERLYWLERGVVYSLVVIAPNPHWRFPCVGSPVWTELVEILLCEGGDVELCARTSKHIRVFAFDPLTLSLSLFYFVPCIDSYCHIILIYLVVIVCASLVFNSLL